MEKGSKVQGSQGPRYLKLTFKYELDSKEGILFNLFTYGYVNYAKSVMETFLCVDKFVLNNDCVVFSVF